MKRNVRPIVSIALCVLILGAATLGPVISDFLVIKNADPAMVQLAQQAGMTRKGELIFLRTNPQFVTANEMTQYCPDSALGCFVPFQNNPSTGHIYIREMPSDLYDVEIDTAAYEMLHPVYASITMQSSDAARTLDTIIDSNYSSINDAVTTSLLTTLLKTEPNAKDDELFSLLATRDYYGLAGSLQAYYAPYLSSLEALTDTNKKIDSLFQDDQNRLNQLQGTITTDANYAKTAYANSVSWAEAGDQYENDRNYNIYLQDINDENTTINQYNALLQSYQDLVAEYNGQQLPTLQNVQSQSQ